MFIDDDFLLDTPQAKTLFHDYAEHQPIIDYHSCLLYTSDAADE